MNRLAMLFLMLTSANAFAAAIGNAIEINNEVLAKYGDKTRVLKVGSSIYANEQIVTASNASAKIKYSNGTEVSILEGSSFQTLSYTPNADQKLNAKLETGKIEYKSAGKKKGFIQTPTVTLAIQGTQFRLLSDNQTCLDVSEGILSDANNTYRAGDSGCWDKLSHFVPGPIPWTSGFKSQDQNISLQIQNAVITDVVQTSVSNSMLNSMMSQPPTALIDAVIICP